MRHHSIATPRHVWQNSFEDLKKSLSNHAELLDDIINKTAETVIIVIAVGCIYKVTQLIHTSNVAYQVYTVALQGLNNIHNICTSQYPSIYHNT